MLADANSKGEIDALVPEGELDFKAFALAALSHFPKFNTGHRNTKFHFLKTTRFFQKIGWFFF